MDAEGGSFAAPVNGDIHIRFGEPVSARSMVGSSDLGDETSIGLQKLAFEVMYRIAHVTPITPTALISVALLAARGTARSSDQLAEAAARIVEFARARDLLTTEDADLRDPAWVATILDWLSEHDNVSSHEALGRRVFWLNEDQMIRISYYRNMVVHFFVNRALAEMAIGSVAEPGDERPEGVREALLAYRDLLKFEFFFPEKEQFLADVESDIAIDAPGWEHVLTTTGAAEVQAKLGSSLAYWAVLPILDAYQVVGDELEALKGRFEEKSFLKACLARARMYRIEERLISGESASQVLFKAALALAANRGPIHDTDGVAMRRAAFATEVRNARALAAAGLVANRLPEVHGAKYGAGATQNNRSFFLCSSSATCGAMYLRYAGPPLLLARLVDELARGLWIGGYQGWREIDEVLRGRLLRDRTVEAVFGAADWGGGRVSLIAARPGWLARAFRLGWARVPVSLARFASPWSGHGGAGHDPPTRGGHQGWRLQRHRRRSPR